MLIVFCNKNQLIAGIEINNRNKLTLYFQNDLEFENAAFISYLFNDLSQHNIIGRMGENSSPTHNAVAHKHSAYLTPLQHTHYIFENDIDLRTMQVIVTAIREYQNPKNLNARRRWRLNNKAILDDAKQRASESLYEGVYAWWHGLTNERYSTIDIISRNNLKELMREFKANSLNTSAALSTNVVMNLFDVNRLPETHLLPKNNFEMEAVTCPEIRQLAFERQLIDDIISTMTTTTAITLTTVALAGLSIFSLFKCCSRRAKLQQKPDATTRPKLQ